MLNSSKKSLAFVRTINHYQPKQRCTVQALSELSALVPTVVRHTGKKTVSLRSGHNGRRQWAGIMSMRKWIGNKTNRRRWTSNEVAKQETAETHRAKRRPETDEFTPRAQERAAGSGQKIKRQQTSTKLSTGRILCYASHAKRSHLQVLLDEACPAA